jgi:hypothetical protein
MHQKHKRQITYAGFELRAKNNPFIPTRRFPLWQNQLRSLLSSRGILLVVVMKMFTITYIIYTCNDQVS